MKEKYFNAAKDLAFLLPVSLTLGALFTWVQSGNWQLRLGVLSFSFLFLLAIAVLKLAYHWSNGGKTLGYIIILTFLIRLVAGTALYVALPVYGHDDEDDRAGYVFTDAHTRDDQAWRLATSDRPILDAFSRNYSSDQYGGLLAFNALIYRYFSPDAQRPLMLILVSAFFSALGIPFLWKAASRVFGEKVARASAWIFALYPYSILLGASAMREPYLMTFSAFAFWGFVNFGVQGLTPVSDGVPQRHDEPSDSKSFIWLGLGLLGMLVVSPAVALVTLILLGGWVLYGHRGRQISWKAVAGIAVTFAIGLLLLSSSLDRAGEIDTASPLSVIGGWLRQAVRLNVYQIEEGSGWVQKIFDESPAWIRLPFVAVYGIFQPVLPAAIIRRTQPIWNLIAFLLGLGWYAMIPMLLLSFIAAIDAKHLLRAGGTGRTRNILLWLSLLTWAWIILSALRGGADFWDNPRYRTILFLWQAILSGYVWVWWRETQNPWFWRIVLMEVAFLLIFTHWYGSRYYHWPGQMPFPMMVAVIFGLWGAILGAGWWLDKRRA